MVYPTKIHFVASIVNENLKEFRIQTFTLNSKKLSFFYIFSCITFGEKWNKSNQKIAKNLTVTIADIYRGTPMVYPK